MNNHVPANPRLTNEPAADLSTPHYGGFGHPADFSAPRHYQAPANDGSNNNPDEFSAFWSPHAAATEHYCMPEAIANPSQQRGHVEQKAAYALDDPRMAGGDVFDLKDEQAGF